MAGVPTGARNTSETIIALLVLVHSRGHRAIFAARFLPHGATCSVIRRGRGLMDLTPVPFRIANVISKLTDGSGRMPSNEIRDDHPGHPLG